MVTNLKLLSMFNKYHWGKDEYSFTVFSGTGSSQRILACLSTLHLFAKIRPQLLVNHALTMQPYLSLKCQVCIIIVSWVMYNLHMYSL